MKVWTKSVGVVLVSVGVWAGAASPAHAYELNLQDLLKQGLLGAGTGAISSGVSGGKAGKGALIGAGTGILGNLVMGLLSGPSQSASYAAPSYSSYSAPATYYEPAPQPVYAAPQPVTYQPTYYASAPTYTASAPAAPVYAAPVYSAPASAPVNDSTRQILKQGLLGAGVGAISAETSGGKAGTGALVGAGTNVIGGALFDTLFATAPAASSSSSASRYEAYPARSSAPVRHILRKFDSNGKLVSEEEYWD